MNRNMRVIQITIMLLSSIVLFVFLTFAWFASLSKTEPIIINTGSLKAECHFYLGIDANDNGIIEENEYEEITEGHLSFSDIIPGDKFTFKLSVTNQGTVAGFLSIKANGIETDYEDLPSYFAFTFTSPFSGNTPLSSGSVVLFQDYVLDAGQTYDFIFSVFISGNTPNEINGKSLTIDNFTVDLIQYH
jgi:hypothetical protein